MGRMNAFEVGIIAFGATLNITIGYLVAALKLPLYLDSTGTIVVSVLCGWKYGILAGLAGLVVMTLVSTPTVAAYAGTVIVIALLSWFFARMGYLKKLPITIVGGILIGISAALVSSPVTAFIYGGVSLAGSDAITTAFRASGMTILQSVFLGSLVVELFDKLITSLLGMFLVHSLPSSILERFRGAGAVISPPVKQSHESQVTSHES